MGMRGKGSVERRAKVRKSEMETQERLPELIRNSRTTGEKRRLLTKLKRLNKHAKSGRRRDRIAAAERGEEVQLGHTRTIENMRKEDSTIVEADEEVAAEEEADEFAPYFKGDTTPKIMVTTVMTLRPCPALISFLKEFLVVFPNCFYYKRKNTTFARVVDFATRHGFTDVMVFNQVANKPYGLYLCHLPEGPTCCFRLTNLKLAQDMKHGGVLSDHRPEIVLNNFDTRLGRRLGRQLASLFPQSPEFQGRRVMTFHNQRDFIFFRHHRYVFKDSTQLKRRGRRKGSTTVENDAEAEVAAFGEAALAAESGGAAAGGKKRVVRAYLKEIGPRFTLKLRSMQLGTFDDRGLFEFAWRPDAQKDRKTFFV